MAKKTVAAPKGISVKKEFEFDLTRDQIHDYGVEMAKLDGGIAELETQFDEVKKGWKAKIDAAEAKRKDISAIVRSKKYKKVVDAILVKEYESKEIFYWVDGKEFERRTMTPAEAQVDLPLKPAKGKRQKLQLVDPIAAAHGADDLQKKEDIQDVIAQETGRKTKNSSVDGPKTDGPGAA